MEAVSACSLTLLLKLDALWDFTVSHRRVQKWNLMLAHACFDIERLIGVQQHV
jgi:hypothetical protein